jgi:hypothetical protein
MNVSINSTRCYYRPFAIDYFRVFWSNEIGPKSCYDTILYANITDECTIDEGVSQDEVELLHCVSSMERTEHVAKPSAIHLFY